MHGRLPGLSIATWNMGGFCDLFEAIDIIFAKTPPRIFVLQEARANQMRFKQVQAKLEGLGFRGWGLVNPPTSLGVTHGGLIVGVRRDIRARLAATHSSEAGEMLTLNMESFDFNCVWQRPSHAQEGGLVEQMLDTAQAARPQGKPWLAVGGFNCEFLENDMVVTGFHIHFPPG